MKIRIPLNWLKKGVRIRIGPKAAGPAASTASPSGPAPLSPSVQAAITRRDVSALLQALQEADPFVRAISAEVLGHLQAKESLDPLIQALKDFSKHVRQRAAIALGHLGERKAVPALIQCLEDPAEEVRVTVAGVLGHLRDRLAVPALIQTSNDTSPLIRMKACISLGILQDPEAIPALYHRLAHDENELVRKYACEALASIGRPAIAALLEALKYEKLRAHAAQALSKIK
ncbi:MAG: HEAT repeat domain-containing protein [Elusimicrobia bacterium]|nr:HEAT repeat domain-containing protein [Elusimicrobiota bacterium]